MNPDTRLAHIHTIALVESLANKIRSICTELRFAVYPGLVAEWLNEDCRLTIMLYSGDYLQDYGLANHRKWLHDRASELVSAWLDANPTKRQLQRFADQIGDIDKAIYSIQEYLTQLPQ